MVGQMKLDVGCGSRCRGDVGITKTGEHSTCDATAHLDVDLEPLGFTYNPNALIIDGDLNEADTIAKFDDRYPCAGPEVLCCHILEHLLAPSNLLFALSRRIKSSRVVIVVPNIVANWPVDYEDEGHLYSFTPASLSHLVSRYFKVQSVRLIANGLDILIEAVP